MTYRIPPELMALLTARPTGLEPESGDTRCHGCHGVNPVWFVENELWNAVMDDEGGILCPTCFMLVAEFRQVVNEDVIWRIERH